MARPTKDNPSIKYIGKTRKGIPVYRWCVTYFDFNDRMNQWIQKQVWFDHEPSKEEIQNAN